MPTYLSDDEALARLALWRCPSVGPSLFQKILNHFGSAVAALQEISSNQIWPFHHKISLDQVNWLQAEKDLAWLQDPNHHLICKHHSLYPDKLTEIDQAPPLLFIKGNPICITKQQVAVVGSRNPSFYGQKVAKEFSEALIECNLTIISGLALGIDAISHQAAVEKDCETIAVLATGLDQIYPKRHKALAEKILSAGGTLISEFGVNTPVKAENFPRRNRIISGLSIGVLVVEANIKSGSLITAKYALAQNREVFAIPGSIKSPLSHGCHALIKQGAKLVETIADIIDELALTYKVNLPNVTAKSPPQGDNALVLKAMEDYPISLEELLERTKLPPAKLYNILFNLEIGDQVSNLPEGYIKKV